MSCMSQVLTMHAVLHGVWDDQLPIVAKEVLRDHRRQYHCFPKRARTTVVLLNGQQWF
jgi:hypothetical protein